jgi:hypothetical protein
MIGTRAACSLAGRPLMSTSTATGCVDGNGEGSAAASAVARQSSALVMPHCHSLLVLLISDMEVAIILFAQRTAKRLDALRRARGPPIGGIS